MSIPSCVVPTASCRGNKDKVKNKKKVRKITKERGKGRGEMIEKSRRLSSLARASLDWISSILMVFVSIHILLSGSSW